MVRCLNLPENYSSFLMVMTITQIFTGNWILNKRLSRTSYTVGGINYKREAIASFPDRVIVIHLTASKPKSISFTASYSTPQPKVEVHTEQSKQLTFAGTTIDHEDVKGMVRYKGIVDFKAMGGTISATDTSLTM